jgi:isopropylmalate/homocitrate/citramalate synthase
MSEKEYRTLTDTHWVADLNAADEVRNQFTLPERVRIHDVTLREAEQAPHVVLRPEEKLRIYEALDEMGVYSTEIFPLVSDDDREVAKELVQMRKSGRTKTKVFFLCRWHKEEVDFALESGADGVIIEGTSVPWFAKVALNGTTEDEMFRMFVETTAHAKKNGIFTTVMPWDTARAPLAWLEKLYKGIVYEGGADHVVIADTHGSSLPGSISTLVRKLRSWVPDTPVEMHCHNDHGLATSIMLSAVCAGVSVVPASIN